MVSVLFLFKDGSLFITVPIAVLLVVILGLIVKAFRQTDNNAKTISLISSFGWFAIAWGFMGRTIGLIGAFDNIAAHGELTPSLVADGLKMALVDPLLAIIVFLIARIGIIVLTMVQKRSVE